jgi:tripartite-type tricarboxylate transporter receptor subunit TctC
MAEAGLAGFEFNSWYGVWAPKGIPADVATKVNTLIQETMRDAAIVKRLRTTLIEPVAESIDDTKKFIRSEIVRAGDLLKSVNFQPS